MKFNEKLYLKQFFSVNSNNIYSSYQNLRSYGKNTKRLFQKINTFEYSNNGSLKILLSGRIRGVSMARKFKMSSAALVKQNTFKKIRDNNKKIKINKMNKLNIVSNLIDKKKSNSHNFTQLAVKPQTINSVGSYRLQYINKDIYTK